MVERLKVYGDSMNGSRGTWYATLLLACVLPAQDRVPPLGSLNPVNLPGEAEFPHGSADIGSRLQSLGQCLAASDVTRLPNGHYLLSACLNQFVEYDVSLGLIGTITAVSVQQGSQVIWDRRDGLDSRVWVGNVTTIHSLDWHSSSFDPSFAIGSPLGVKFLDGVVHSNGSINATIGRVAGQDVWISAGSQSGDPFNYHRMGSVDSTLPQFQSPSLAGTSIDGLKGHAVFDPLSETMWWSEWNPLVQSRPLRYVEHDISGTLTGRVYQPELPFQQMTDRINSTRVQGADMYLDRDGNRVLVFLISQAEGINQSKVIRQALVETHADFVYGDGCNGSLSFLGDLRIGADWQIKLLDPGAGSGSTAFLSRGVPSLDWFPMVPGVTNCSLHIDLNKPLARVVSEPFILGEAAHTLAIPDESSLIGIELGFQWLLPTAPLNLPLGLSDAGTVRIGIGY